MLREIVHIRVELPLQLIPYREIGVAKLTLDYCYDVQKRYK